MKKSSGKRRRGRPSKMRMTPDGSWEKWCPDCKDYVFLDEFRFNPRTGYFAGYCKKHATINSKLWLLNKGIFERRAYQIFHRAKHHGIPHESVEELAAAIERLWKEQEGKCYISGLPMKVEANWHDDPIYAWQVDRIDPIGGYVASNIGLSLTVLNWVRKNMSLEDFFHLCDIVVAFRKKSKKKAS